MNSPFRKPGRRNVSHEVERLENRELMAINVLAAPAPEAAAAIARTTTPTASRDTTRNQTGSIPTPVAFVLASPRRFDGTGNNIAHPEWGSTGEQLLRAADNDYADGISAMSGEDRPSARVISNAIAALGEDAAPNARELSAFIYVWGQFIDHDMDLTESSVTNPERAPIAAPVGDLQFDPDGTGVQVIPFTRSVYDPATGTSTENPRQQINQITAWIDGSMIYGSSAERADNLRSDVGGKMLTSAGNLPPMDAEGFIAGDIRANENIELTSMQTLFLREHNYWAGKIARDNPRLSDEQIYQRARAIVIAEVQSITYNEFLPALIGRQAIDRYAGYDATVNPAIANEFSTAAFRLHTLINDDVEFFGNDGRAVRDEVELRDAFFNPSLLRETGIDTILKYAASTQAQEVDNQIVDGLRNFLFGLPGQGGLDLAALNIQRGRDHGLADYNTVRAAYGFERAETFADITSDAAVAAKLQSIYGTVDNIDLWVGLLDEDHAPDATVGQTSQAIIADQFARIRDGDRYWYQNIFTGAQRSQLEQTKLSDIIRRNTTTSNLQDNVFYMQARVGGVVFADANGDGRPGTREATLAGVTLELLDDEGEVIATTTTDRRGRYQFDTFAETGDYTIRVVPPAGQAAASARSRAILIAKGGVTLGDVNFGLRPAKRGSLTASNAASAITATTSGPTAHDAAVDAAVDSALVELTGASPLRAMARPRR